jgi:hypothetical protein
VPADDRPGLHDHQDVGPAGPDDAKSGPEESVETTQHRSRTLSVSEEYPDGAKERGDESDHETQGLTRLTSSFTGYPLLSEVLEFLRSQKPGPVMATHTDAIHSSVTHMLRLSSGFTLGFVRLNHSSLRNRLVSAIRTALPEMQIGEIALYAIGDQFGIWSRDGRSP